MQGTIRVGENKKLFIFDTTTDKKRKMQIRARTRRAVKSEKINKLPCVICGSINSEAHHTDYNKWYEPTWVCHKHHLDLHIMKNGHNTLESQNNGEE